MANFKVGDIAYANSRTKSFYGYMSIKHNCVVEVIAIENIYRVKVKVIYNKIYRFIGATHIVWANDFSKINKRAISSKPYLVRFAIKENDIFAK